MRGGVCQQAVVWRQPDVIFCLCHRSVQPVLQLRCSGNLYWVSGTSGTCVGNLTPHVQNRVAVIQTSVCSFHNLTPQQSTSYLHVIGFPKMITIPVKRPTDTQQRAALIWPLTVGSAGSDPQYAHTPKNDVQTAGQYSFTES